jgi:integrase
MPRRSIVTVFVRHRGGCKDKHRGEFYRGCQCTKWLRYSLTGKQHREATGARSWGTAEEKAQDKQRRLDSGESDAPIALITPKPTIEQAIKTFIRGKEGANRSSATMRKWKYLLGAFEDFMLARSRVFPSDITADDVIELRGSWKWKSGVTKQKAQTHIRSFIRFACRQNRDELLAALDTIYQSKADKERTAPKPFTEKELEKLLAQVPKTFPDRKKSARMTTLIHVMVSTGLAIRDTIQLEKEHIKDGRLKLNRQKNGKAVKQKLDPKLHQELLGVLNGNDRYIFWSGTTLPTSETGLWQTDLRALMKDAGLWIKGNLSHRFRDTAVDFWLGADCGINEIAALLGDSPLVVQKHYADLASKRMEERLAKVPTRSW